MKMTLVAAVVLVWCSWTGIAAAAATREFTPDAVVNAAAHYPEGPQLIDEGLLVAEMVKDRVVLIKAGAATPVWSAAKCGPTSIKRIPSGGYWVLCHVGHYVARLDATFGTLRTVETTATGRRITWPNDGSVDTQGNIYLSSSGRFSLGAPAEGRVVFIDVNTGIASDLAGGIRYSNGVLIQQELNRVLVSEHLNRRILAFPLLGPGRLGAPTEFFNFRDAPLIFRDYAQSGPDGIAAFADGDICVADYGNARILVLSSGGRFLNKIDLKYRFVTNIAIEKDQRALFVTMTRDNTSAELDGWVQKFKVTRAGE